MSMDSILYGLSYYVKINLIKFTSTIDLGDKLQNVYKVEEEENEEPCEKGEGSSSNNDTRDEYH